MNGTHEPMIQLWRTLALEWLSICHRTVPLCICRWLFRGGGRLRPDLTRDSRNVFNLNINLRTIGWRANPSRSQPFLKCLPIDLPSLPLPREYTRDRTADSFVRRAWISCWYWLITSEHNGRRNSPRKFCFDDVFDLIHDVSIRNIFLVNLRYQIGKRKLEEFT